MSATLNAKRTNITRPQFRYRREATDRPRARIPDRRHVTQTAAEEKEMAFVARWVFTLAFLGITPLILFLVIDYFQR